MLHPYRGKLLCVVNYNDGFTAFCDIEDAVSINPEASIWDEYWPCTSGVELNADLLELSKDEFLAQYPVGRAFLLEVMVRVIGFHPNISTAGPGGSAAACPGE
jgi:hypothetical protein